MILLLLMGLGAAGVKAQVRIGGNTAPNAATVLDLNANNNANPAGNKGLGLPRVALANDTTMLTPGVANLNGMMVYNTANTLGGAGLYYWAGSRAQWIKASLPATSAADSGKVLLSNGSSWVASVQSLARVQSPDTVYAWQSAAVSWVKVLDTTLTYQIPAGYYYAVPALGIAARDRCNFWTSSGGCTVTSNSGILYINSTTRSSVPLGNYQIVCYRPV